MVKRVLCAAALGCLILSSGATGAVGSTTRQTGPGAGLQEALLSVSMTSADSGWAVGKNLASRGVIVKHWDGVSWQPTAVPHPALGDTVLMAVDSTSADDVWTVGSVSHDSGASSSFILHWDGSSWHRTPPSHDGGSLFAISAISPSDAWAVGYDYRQQVPFSLHWDGRTWTRIALPAGLSGKLTFLEALTAVSPNNVWLAGAVQPRGFHLPVVVYGHWNGQRWVRMKSPEPQGRLLLQTIHALAAPTGDDVWAAGLASNPNSGNAGGLLEHWDGAKWTIVPSPQPAAFVRLNSIATVSEDDVWAVGNSEAGKNIRALAEHWDGVKWTQTDTTQIDGSPELTDVSAVSPKNVWAVGASESGQIIIHWNGTRWNEIHPKD